MLKAASFVPKEKKFLKEQEKKRNVDRLHMRGGNLKKRGGCRRQLGGGGGVLFLRKSLGIRSSETPFP